MMEGRERHICAHGNSHSVNALRTRLEHSYDDKVVDEDAVQSFLPHASVMSMPPPH